MRDYNKKPIVIKDYNSIFSCLFSLPFVLGCFIALFVFENKIVISALIGQMFFIHIRPYIFYGRKRSIRLFNNRIDFCQNNHLVESINLDKKFEIYKTFDDYYHKSQKLDKFANFFRFISVPVSYLLYYLPILIIKFLFYFFKTKGTFYKFYDCIIIFQGDKILNILATSRYERALVKKYFLDKFQIDIDKLNFYKKLFHGFENIKLGEFGE